MRFWLGTHLPSWLADSTVELFVSHLRLHRRRRFPRAACAWALDSGAFTQISLAGRFADSAAGYAAKVRRYRDEIGLLSWAAPQDHMCEPWVLARSAVATTVRQAQAWTVANYLDLRSADDTLPFIPVLQGATLGDYLDHIDAYAYAGVDLATVDLVGLGSVCRRQATAEIAQLVGALSFDLPLHGFGVKTTGLGLYRPFLASADSMAWSYRGRRIRPCPHTGLTSCANCRPHALAWRANALRDRRERPVQLGLFA